MNVDNQSELYARTPRLRGDLSAGELAYVRLVREQQESKQRTLRLLQVLFSIAAYAVGGIIGIAVSEVVLSRGLVIPDDSSGPGTAILAGGLMLIFAFVGLIAGLLCVGLIQLGIFLIPGILVRRRREGDSAD